MSTRNDISDGSLFDTLRSGLIYTEVLGWIDMGHARGDDINELRNQFHAGEYSGEKYYEIIYRQDMRLAKLGNRIGIGKFIRWKIKSGMNQEDINRIMLSMVMNTAAKFEGQQSLRAFSWYTDSGFSGEDLVSDLFGFYRALLPKSYSSQVKPVSHSAALRRWDFYGAIGTYKNRSFQPLLFPDPADPCIMHRPYKANLPHFMTWLRPWDDFSSGRVTVLTENGNTVEFNKGRRK